MPLSKPHVSSPLRVAELSPAKHGDLPEILALLQRCQLLEDGVAAAIDDFLVARSVDGILGCAGFETYGDLGLLRSVAVEPRVRKLGLGRDLVLGVVDAMRRRGLHELFLLTTTAAPFFEHLGFVAIPRGSVPPGVAASWEFRVGCPQTALPMRLVRGEVP
jgi:amino-acid N-acetyltransferase